MIAYYRDIRDCVGLLLSEGHAHAKKYPLGYLWNEVRFSRRRMYARMRTEALLHRVAVNGTQEQVRETMEKLDDA